MQHRSWTKRSWYRGLQVTCQLAGVSFFQVRCTGRRQIPPTGGAILLANHQSLLDPVFIGLACERRLNYLARSSLFQFLPVKWLLDSLDAIPIDRDGVGLSGLKETLRRLKRDEIVLIFPEGTRTSDGQLQRIKPGFLSLARRTRVPLVPVALDGAYEAWPRTQLLPRHGVVEIEFGRPISSQRVAQMDDESLLHEVECRLRECHTSARQRRLRRLGRVAAPHSQPEIDVTTTRPPSLKLPAGLDFEPATRL